jgi:hypothetical protein
MKNLLFNLKAVQIGTGTSKAQVGAGTETFLKVRAGAETNSFGSAALNATL